MRGHREGPSQRVTFTQRSKEANHVTIWEKTNLSKGMYLVCVRNSKKMDTDVPGEGCGWVKNVGKDEGLGHHGFVGKEFWK